MRLFSIDVPIWYGRKVGLAEDKMDSPLLAVEITYSTSSGSRLYPGFFYISKEKAMTYPTQYCKGHTLRIIPIADLGRAVLCETGGGI